MDNHMDATQGADEWMDDEMDVDENDLDEEGVDTCNCGLCQCRNEVFQFGDVCDACMCEHIIMPA